jgi:hypothetical protein
VRALLKTLNRAQAVTLTQERQHIEDHAAFAPQCFKERPRVGAKSVKTCSTIETPFNVTVDFDVASINFAKVRTVGLSTPLSFVFHDASPPNEADDTSSASFWLADITIAFHGLTIQLPIFTA